MIKNIREQHLKETKAYVDSKISETPEMMKNNFEQHLKETQAFVNSKISEPPEIAVVLGSGLGPLADLIESPTTIAYEKIPHFVQSTVSGHAGELIAGKLNGKNIICMNGRFHYYEGYTFEELTYPIRLFKAMGIKMLLLTNAVGGINTDFKAGDLMVIEDHINFLGDNPLRGPNHDFLGPRFPDMSEVYSKRLVSIAKQTGDNLGINLQSGVFAALIGPSYETPAEIRMLRTLGADAVGMSVVPEAIVANHMGMEILAISCVTNAAAGINDQKLSHEEVKDVAALIKDNFTRLISTIIKNTEIK